MIPGQTSKLTDVTLASAASIKATADILVLTGVVGLNTIIPMQQERSQMVILITQGIVVIGTTGNILVGTTTVPFRPVILVYLNDTQKWHIVGGAASV